MKMKKLGASILATIMATSMLAGCGQSSTQTPETTSDAQVTEATEVASDAATAADEAAATKSIEPTEITFWHYMTGNLEETLTALTDEFNSTNEYGITVTLVNQGYASDLQTKLQASAAADALPDLTQAYNNWLTPYLDKIVHLDDFVANDFDNWDDIVEAYRGECSEFGFVHAVPFNKSTYVLFYNKTLFDELGIEAPKTWADVEADAKIVKDAKGIAFIGYDDSTGAIEATLKQNGENFVDETGALFDTDGGREAFEYLSNLYSNGYARLVGEDGYFSNVISNQNIASYVGSSAGVSYITAEGWELGVAPLPGNKVNAANMAGTNIVMFSQDTNKQLAAWEYLKFLTSTESTSKWAVSTGYLPVRQSAYETAEYKAYMEENICAAACYEQSKDFFYSPTFDASNDIRNSVSPAFEQLVLDKADAQTWFDTILSTINAQY
ncbi:multiple sugar transport system substrate-binding protein [Butyrivibrio proteoclasticus]|uniref:Multiple sugar transport system substrate-binding protein n=1 Tax=Butyrivibrio proteoclasticus TaxID=43305 RepID=A0A1I5R197_9FIRM|nr:ABC transporter substrate-binding protein [Butyrivibrio proteoclasticus]SFP52282.1 multiple sugar transport system substrate-binding protein [Butyrivibrio proteoclasticus]